MQDNIPTNNLNDLFYKIIYLSIIACLLTFVYEYFFPHRYDYITTLGFFTISVLAFIFFKFKKRTVAYHILLVGIACLFLVMNIGLDHRYLSSFIIYNFGILFCFIFFENIWVAVFYLLFYHFCELFLGYTILNDTGMFNYTLAFYESMHFTAYNIGFLFMCVFYFNQQKVLQKERKENALLFLNGQVKERKEIAQNLHDCLSLQIFRIQLHLQSNNFSKNKHLVLEDLQNLSDNLRRISHSLNPIGLEQNGLVHAIEEEIYKIELTTEAIDLNFDNQLPNIPLNKSKSEILFYSALELIRNAMLHSGCSKLNLSLSMEGNKIILTVSDNGSGYAPHRKRKGTGLANILSRVNLLEGKFIIRKNKMSGMTHTIII